MSKEAEFGKWYLFCACRFCLLQIPIVEDPSEGKSKLTGPGRLLVNCPHCSKENEFGTHEVTAGRLERKQ
jgi:hypothetical protein